MNIRFDIQEDIKLKIKAHIKKHHKDIMLNSRLVGIKKVEEWKDYLVKDQIGVSDVPVNKTKNMISFGNLDISYKMNHLIQEIFPNKKVAPTGHFHYPPTGYMGWHTNSNATGMRMYVTWTEEAKKSFFRYVHNGEMFTDYDDAGLTVRLFEVVDKEPFFWHCVGSETDRLSFGYSIL